MQLSPFEETEEGQLLQQDAAAAAAAAGAADAAAAAEDAAEESEEITNPFLCKTEIETINNALQEAVQQVKTLNPS